MNRKVPDKVQKVFDKYCVNFVRRLNKQKALEMFATEFKLNPERAEIMFEMFDKDRNDILSAWEFYLFYESFGYDANEYLDLFDKLANDAQQADPSGTWDFLKTLKTLSGRGFEDEELETTMMAILGQEKTLDKKKFIELISRVKMTRS
ncbi:hypothetical protein MAR_021365 [Mya arenaria]|uniref:EF-hand domain-containing protein n=1 Tax=Mya arenaria TaxID=6604 RepID=A0ABY7EFQ4_MYAAR|nr:uncharacterized protein LOC128235051 [Mya arenaria]WAR05996.1 hypothetical protein MAR_021365 [Mya arenaria]